MLVEKRIHQAALIPASLLGLLPLHAAFAGGQYALDQVCFSYLPSANALKIALNQANCPAEAILAVDDPR